VRSGDGDEIDDANSEITAPWSSNTRAPTGTVESDGENDAAPNEGLIQSVVRAHAWKRALVDGAHDSVEMLAEANRLHPKVVRQALRLAFLSPDVTLAILEGRQPQKAFDGANPKAASVVVDKASSPARLTFGGSP
jgi:site-specific DNA recombinase